jgi:uncharacterized protein (TIGR00255 family)
MNAMPTGVKSSEQLNAQAAVRSMTGFAQARLEENGLRLRISIRSVNHRFLDVRVHLPDGLDAIEPRIREMLRERMRRGHVDVTLHLEPIAQNAARVNTELAEAYLKAAEELRRKFGLTTEPDLLGLFRLPGVVAASAEVAGAAEEKQNEENLGRAVESCLAQSLKQLDHMRAAEGAALVRQMQTLLGQIAERTARVEEIAVRSRPTIAKHLAARLAELLGEAQIDPARLAQEAALLVERGDTSEELARLRSHLDQFGALLATGGEVGKKLDFLLQEMQREANTLLSKTPGVERDGFEITELGLEIKSDIEKLREQVQNVE